MNKGLLIGGGVLLISSLFLIPKNSNDGTAGSNIWSFVPTKTGSEETPISYGTDSYTTNYNIPEADYSKFTSSDIADSGETKKSYNSSSNIASGKIETSSGSGVYTNPNKNASNIFDTSVPSYTDGLGQGVSYNHKQATKKAKKISPIQQIALPWSGLF